jgi:integrase
MKWLFKKLKHKSEYVFTSPATGTKYTELKRTFARTVKRANIPHITFHELRHTTASRMNELGIDIATIQEYLDHADIKTTRGYIHKPRKNIEFAIEKLSKYSL